MDKWQTDKTKALPEEKIPAALSDFEAQKQQRILCQGQPLFGDVHGWEDDGFAPAKTRCRIMCKTHGYLA